MPRRRLRNVARILGAVFAIALVAAVFPPTMVQAEGGWLDDQSAAWNTAGMAIPRPMQPGGPMNSDPRCAQQARPAETDADRAVTAAGWTLFGGYQGGWGIQIVQGLAEYDGMCRANQYQAFVFVDGQFAGTLSPVAMDARTDGALNTLNFYGPRNIVGGFARYTPQDALCCPSARSTVQYRVEKTPAGSVLLRERTTTEPTSAALTAPDAPRPSVAVPAPVQAPAAR